MIKTAFPRQPNGPVQSVKSNIDFSHDSNPQPSGDANQADMHKFIGNGGYNPIIADDIIAPYMPKETLSRYAR